ncbi:MAG: acyltransferase family protein [Rikenellaceae bacterium]
MTQNQTKPNYNEITWISALRILACLLVIIAHCCDPFVSGDSVEGFNAGALWGTLCRASVPLFMMISGVLLLPSKLSVGDFYSRRLKRILIPFIFWSLVSPWLFYVFTQSMDTVNPTIIAENHTLLATIQASYLWLFNFSYSTIPYWYIYMMIGVYLIIPLISDWLKKASRRDLHIVLGIWLFTTIVPYIQAALPLIGYAGNYGSMGIYGECSWNIFTTFQYVGGFLGYTLLAHYLVRFPLSWSLSKTLLIGGLIFVAGYAITLYGFHYTRDNYPDNFNMLEVIWSFTNINVVMMTVALFIIVQKIEFKPAAWISSLSAATFGIFLLHFVVVHVVYELIAQNLVFNPILQILVIGIISFILTSVIMVLLRKTPLFRKLS